MTQLAETETADNRADGPAGPTQWLPLREVCRLLEVSDTTLRQWADNGHLPVYRTPGGHRRFLRQDVESLIGAPGPAAAAPARSGGPPEAPALRKIRRRLAQNNVTQQPWYQGVEPQGRERMRLFGRRLLSLLLQESGPRRQRQESLEEARLLGREYGAGMQERAVSLADTLQAFVFFRALVLDSAPQSAWPRILETSDQVLLSLAQSYEPPTPPPP